MIKLSVSLTFYGGVNEIGGNKILLKDSDKKILLDFGMSFKQRKKFFSDPYLSPRKDDVDCLLKTNLLPPELEGKGVYEFEEGEKGIDFVLLSHYHADHAQYISFIKRDVPIICSSKTKVALHALYSRQLPKNQWRWMRHKNGEEFFVPMGCNTRGGFEKDISRLKIGYLDETASKEFDIIRESKDDSLLPWSILWENYRIETKDGYADDWYIKPFPVNHSIEGATAWAVNTAIGPIIYTGDFRLGELTNKFVQEAKKIEPTVMICEGTNVGRNEEYLPNENAVKEKISEVVNDTENLVFIDFNYGNMDRLKSLLEISKKHGRKLVISLRQAHFSLMLSLVDSSIPDIRKENIWIYTRKKETTYTWEENILQNEHFKSRILHDTDLSKSQEEYILSFSYFDLKELPGIEPKQGSSYIISHSEPFDEEGEIEENILTNWIDLFKLKKYRIHTSGHISNSELLDTIEKIHPKILIPVHTEHPEMIKKEVEKLGINVILSQYGKEISIPR